MHESLNNMIIPHIPFYFVRHGQTDWNKTNQTLCAQDNIQLNATGLIQADNTARVLENLGIKEIHSSPLMRARQTAEIINKDIKVSIKFHENLASIVSENIILAFKDILKTGHTTLIVSHGEVYRKLLQILNAQATNLNAKNSGLYFFNPPHLEYTQWSAQTIHTQD